MQWLLFFAVVVLAFPSHAGPQPLQRTNPAAPATITNAPIKKISENILEIGKVRLEKNERRISFPATVNMQEGIVEYLLVNTTGKVHESVLKTEAEPFHIHTAMLLLGAKGGEVKTKTPQKNVSEVAGDNVNIFISCPTTYAGKTFPAEEWILEKQTKTNASRGFWAYNGSRLIEGNFLAQRDGSIISMIADPDALANNPRPGRDDDEMWLVNTNVVPAVNTSVTVTIQLEKK